MKNLLITILSIALMTGIYCQKANALINLDDESVKIAIKYGLDNKYSSTKELMGPNWIEGEGGLLITVFSPFIQLATKAKSQNVPGSSDEDIVLVKKRLGRQLNQIKTRQQVRFIVQLTGDSPKFAKEYTAKIEQIRDPEQVEKEEAKKGKGFWVFKSKGAKKPKKIAPDKTIQQTVAEMDHYNPMHPYSATNSYNFDFEAVNKFDKFYFILIGPDEKEQRYMVDKNAIF